jgi:putative hydrolase of the HAD superfamily
MPILFDLDDTLLDDASTQDIYLGQLLDLYRAELAFESVASFRVAWRAAIERHFARYLSGELSMLEQRRARIRELFAEPEMSDARTDVVVAEFLKKYEAAWRLFPDVVRTLDALAGTPLGVITNGAPEQQLKKLHALGIADRFDVIVVSEAVGYAKPQRQIFEHACEQLGCAPEDCVFVGDDWARDVGGSAAVNMTPIWRNHGERVAAREGVLAVSALSELLERDDVRARIDRVRR